jgi:putative spermidine/putrescine transport system substrate-binding protein
MNFQLSRRNFLQASTAIALSQLLSGCSNTKTAIQVLFLENSVPLQLIGDFNNTIKAREKVDFEPIAQITQILNRLIDLQSEKKPDRETKTWMNRTFTKSIIYPNLFTLGDVWLTFAIKQNSIQPLSVKNLANWQKLPQSWQKLVRRDSQGNLADDGKIYGAPYRWGSTVIAYRSDKLDRLNLSVRDWADLWQPALRDRLSLLDSPRETIGLTLKKLGSSYNTKNLSSVSELETELLALHQQAKLYSSDHYLEPLILGDTWVAVGWSTDILPLLKRYPDIKFVIPQSGASLWADLWVEPTKSVNPSISEDESIANIVEQWIDYCWKPQAAKQISLFTDGISPILPTLEPEEIPKDLQDNIFLNSTVLNSDKSEFLLPLEAETEQQYRDLWLKIRQSR